MKDEAKNNAEVKVMWKSTLKLSHTPNDTHTRSPHARSPAVFPEAGAGGMPKRLTKSLKISRSRKHSSLLHLLDKDNHSAQNAKTITQQCQATSNSATKPKRRDPKHFTFDDIGDNPSGSQHGNHQQQQQQQGSLEDDVLAAINIAKAAVAGRQGAGRQGAGRQGAPQEAPQEALQTTLQTASQAAEQQYRTDPGSGFPPPALKAYTVTGIVPLLNTAATRTLQRQAKNHTRSSLGSIGGAIGVGSQLQGGDTDDTEAEMTGGKVRSWTTR